MADHYFSEAPTGEARLRTLTVRLAGRDVEVDTAGGVFSPGHVDTGTRILLQHVPEPSPGALLDLGCGPIALDAALRARESRVPLQVWAVDVNERARELTARNAAALGLPDVRTVAPEDVPAEVRFSAIWSNPPIRVGKSVLHGMLSTWLPRLEPGGAAHLVVAKKLGADSLRGWLEREFGADCDVERTATAKGFRILQVTRRP